jgi:chromate transport protein ChrA
MRERAETQLHTGWAKKMGREVREYAVISLYLYICFGAILLYKAAVLQARGLDYAPFGLAAIKALILAKFILIGHATKLGERYREKPLIYSILHKSIVFLVLVIVLSVIEEVVAGALHGRSVAASLSEIAGGTWFEIVATALLLWLILLPYFAFRQISERLGKGRLSRMLFFESARPSTPD